VRAVRIHAHGGPELLAVEELPVPRPAPVELLVRTAVVGVGRPDVRLIRAAHVPLPHTPGGDVAGRVASRRASRAQAHDQRPGARTNRI
jgi:NADPH:quinone reductase